MRNSTDLFRSFGFDTQPVLIGLIIFQVLLSTNSTHQFIQGLDLKYLYASHLICAFRGSMLLNCAQV